MKYSTPYKIKKSNFSMIILYYYLFNLWIILINIILKKVYDYDFIINAMKIFYPLFCWILVLI